ncbi:CMRF35-like molecule 3 [Esox lucius]|uniref:Ig-like domain-containing protein n=1 Tax=Esox lucius TaxID=8010 RepID=A0A3P8Y7G8_ESOLU|nr:CMRF35-like molecule 3 [Esox lucius]
MTPSDLIFSLVLITRLPGCFCGVTTVEDHSVLEGESVVIPCHYEPQYAGYVKYWCHGKMKDFCTSLARSDAPWTPAGQGKVVLFDDPVQQVFTVTMKNLQEADSGWYWCGVEVGGVWSADVTASLHINVFQGLSVVNRMLRGEEGSSITVQCLYSQGLRLTEKRWCRSGDWSSCVLTDSEGRYEDQAVEIRDNLTNAFTVTLKSLAQKDTGWYWCAAGQKQLPVHIFVATPATTVLVAKMTSTPEDTESKFVPTPPSSPPRLISNGAEHHRTLWEYSLMVCGVLFIVLVLVLLPWKIQVQYIKNKRKRQAEELKAKQSDPQCGDDWKNSSVILFNSTSDKMFGF